MTFEVARTAQALSLLSGTLRRSGHYSVSTTQMYSEACKHLLIPRLVISEFSSVLKMPTSEPGASALCAAAPA